MIENLPFYISIIFGLTTIATLVLFYGVIKNSAIETTRKNANQVLVVLIFWLALQAALAYNDVFNSSPNAFPPKIAMFGIWPAILTIIVLFATAKGRRSIDSLPLMNITYLNIIRIPVELVLYWLFLNKAVPELMTFSGRNFDIISGITAPFIAYFGFKKGVLNEKVILIWNFICLGLLANIVINAILSIPTPIQQFAFDQPNIAVLNFPFNWLPSFVVPIVLFGHLVSIRQLLMKSKH